MSTRLIPGTSATLFAVQVACHALQVAATPFTVTERVVIALARPARFVVAVVVCGKPSRAAGPVVTEMLVGMSVAR